MESTDILKGKKILAVDDEHDVLEIIQERLETCVVTTADSHEQATGILSKESFDMVLLDIMGVNGFDLLDQCREKGQPAAMLTAHAINVESVYRAVKSGAISFLPKDELINLELHLSEIFESIDQERSHWRQLFRRLGPYFKERLGITWEDLDETLDHSSMF